MTSIKGQICCHFHECVDGSSLSQPYSCFRVFLYEVAEKGKHFPSSTPVPLMHTRGINEMLAYVLSRRNQQLLTGMFLGFT